MAITLVANDGQRFDVAAATAARMGTVQAFLGSLAEDGEGAPLDVDVPVPNVEGDVLRRVVDFCARCEEEAWDNAAFVEECKSAPAPEPTRHGVLFQVTNAAHYLDAKRLLDVMCDALADLLRGKSAEEIRETLGIVNDFTPEEEEALQRECAWAFDA